MRSGHHPAGSAAQTSPNLLQARGDGFFPPYLLPRAWPPAALVLDKQVAGPNTFRANASASAARRILLLDRPEVVSPRETGYLGRTQASGCFPD